MSDVLAHLIAWDLEAVRRWGEIRDGAESVYRSHAFNAEATSARRDAPWDELLVAHARAHAELLEQARTQPAAVRGDRRFREWIAALRKHYAVHTERLERELSRR